MEDNNNNKLSSNVHHYNMRAVLTLSCSLLLSWLIVSLIMVIGPTLNVWTVASSVFFAMTGLYILTAKIIDATDIDWYAYCFGLSFSAAIQALLGCIFLSWWAGYGWSLFAGILIMLILVITNLLVEKFGSNPVMLFRSNKKMRSNA